MRLRVMVGIVAVALIVGFLLWRNEARPVGLGSSADASETFVQVGVGGEAWIGYFDFPVEGDAPVRLVSARLTGVPRGLTVLGIYATQPVEGNRVGAARDLKAEAPWVQLRPTWDAVLRPGDRLQDWYLLAHVRGTVLGKQIADGIEIRWRAGERTGVTRYPLAGGVEATDPPPALPSPAAPTTTAG